MQVIAAATPASRGDRLAIARSLIAAVLLLVAGAMLAWLCLGTPVIGQFLPSGRASTLQTAVWIAVWGFAIVVPAGFLIIGIAHVLGVLDDVAALRPRAVTPGLAAALGPDHLAATNLVVPGGRRIHELVVGPFGIVVLGDVPPPSVSRRVGARWEAHDSGRWIPIEAPADRTDRDAERVRGWLTTDDRDFLAKVYAAIVTDDPRVERTVTCAVVPSADIANWLAALPVQRGLTPARREHLVELIRSVASPR